MLKLSSMCQLQKSLANFKIIQYLEAFWLGMMISILFLHAVGCSDAEIATMHLIAGILIFILEFPTGLVADRFSYKLSIFLSYICLGIFFACLVGGYYFNPYLVIYLAPVFLALAKTLFSGAGTAYVYLLHQKLGKTEQYLRYMTQLEKVSSYINAAGIIIGAYLFSMHPVLPYSIQVFLMLLAAIVALSLYDDSAEQKAKCFATLFKSTLKYFIVNRTVQVLAIAFVFLIVAFEFFHHVVNQSIFLELGLSIPQIGFLGVIVYLLRGCFISLAPRLWELFGQKNSFLLCQLLTVILPFLLLYSHNFFYISFVCALIYFTHKLALLFIDYALQQKIKTNRASMLSLVSMLAAIPIRLVYFLPLMLLGGETYLIMFLIVSLFCGVIGLLLLLSKS